MSKKPNGRYIRLAAASIKAVRAAGIDPSTLAADPEAIKRVVEAAINVRANYPQRVAMMPHVKALDTALRAIGKEQA